jgi:hypothetical protein
MQMVVVPAISTNATTDIAKVSFTVLPSGTVQDGNRLIGWN